MSTENNTPRGAAHIGTGLALGLVCGLLFGIGSEHQAVFLALGLSLGIIGGFGTMLISNRKK